MKADVKALKKEELIQELGFAREQLRKLSARERALKEEIHRRGIKRGKSNDFVLLIQDVAQSRFSIERLKRFAVRNKIASKEEVDRWAAGFYESVSHKRIEIARRVVLRGGEK